MVSVSVISRSYPAVAHTNVVAMFIASQLKSANACLGRYFSQGSMQWNNIVYAFQQS